MKIYRTHEDVAWDFPYKYPERKDYPIWGYFYEIKKWALIEIIDCNPDRQDRFSHWTNSIIKPRFRPSHYRKK